MNHQNPQFQKPAGLFEHQTICMDVIGAYHHLSLVNQAELERAFAGDMNVRDIHQLAKRLLAETSPEHMALVVARLVVMANEAPLTAEDPFKPVMEGFALGAFGITAPTVGG